VHYDYRIAERDLGGREIASGKNERERDRKGAKQRTKASTTK
jgi:hypothetical protein